MIRPCAVRIYFCNSYNNHPVVVVLLAQIKANLWVRNGLGIRSQAHHYCLAHIRTFTLDNDISLIQYLGVQTEEPSQFLFHLVSNFELGNLIFQNSDHLPYDASQSTFMLEEFLHLLIILCTDFHFLFKEVFLTTTLEIAVANNCIVPITFSELEKRLPEKMTEHLNFKTTVHRITDYVHLDASSDRGMFQLKQEYEQLVDPYFFLLARNQRTEVEDAMRERWRRRGLEWFSRPSDAPCIPAGKFREKLTKFLYTVEFGQILYSALIRSSWKALSYGDNSVETPVSDVICDEVLHLLLIVLNDIRGDEAKAAIFSKILLHQFNYIDDMPQRQDQHSKHDRNILYQIWLISRSNAFKDLHGKAKYVIATIRDLQIVAVSNYFTKILDQNSEQKSEAPVHMEPKNREDARKLKAKLMADFAKQQAEFLAKYNEELMDDDDYDALNDNKKDDMPSSTYNKAKSSWDYPVGSCIVCQENLDASLSYGLLCFVQASVMQKRSSFIDISQIPVYKNDLSGSIDIKRDISRRPGLFISTCGHLMHYLCFSSYNDGIKQQHNLHPARNHPENPLRGEFLCPLCKTIGNILLPMRGRPLRNRFQINNDDITNWKQSTENQLQSLWASLRSNSKNTAEEENQVNQSTHTFRQSEFSSTLSGFDPRPETQIRVASQLMNNFLRLNQNVRSGRISTSRVLDAESCSKLLNISSQSASDFVHEISALAETLRLIWRDTDRDFFEYVPCSKPLLSSDLMADLIAYSISCLESVYREHVDSLIKNPAFRLKLNTLRYFCEFLAAYVLLMDGTPSTRAKSDTFKFETLRQLIPAMNTGREIFPLLSLDPFTALVVYSFVNINCDVDYLQTIRIFYMNRAMNKLLKFHLK